MLPNTDQRILLDGHMLTRTDGYISAPSKEGNIARHKVTFS